MTDQTYTPPPKGYEPERKPSLWQRFKSWPLIARIGAIGCGGLVILTLALVALGGILWAVDPDGMDEIRAEQEQERLDQEVADAEEEARLEAEEAEAAGREAEEEAEREAEEEAAAERDAEEERQREEEEAERLAEEERAAEEAERLEGLTEVPDVSGQVADDAREELRDLGFEVTYEADSGTVWDGSNWEAESTSPAAGELIEDEAEVTLNVVRPEEYTQAEEERAQEREAEAAAQFEVEHDGDDLGGLVPGGTTFVRFEISDNFTRGMIGSGAQRDTCIALERGLEEHPDTGRVAVEGSFPTTDEFGNDGDSTILRAHYDRSTLEQINFDNCRVIDIWTVRDGGMIHPDLLD